MSQPRYVTVGARVVLACWLDFLFACALHVVFWLPWRDAFIVAIKLPVAAVVIGGLMVALLFGTFWLVGVATEWS